MGRLAQAYKVVRFEKGQADIVYPANWQATQTKVGTQISSNLAASVGQWETTQALNISITAAEPFTGAVKSRLETSLYGGFGCQTGNKANKIGAIEVEEINALQIAYGSCTFMNQEGTKPRRVWLYAIVSDGASAVSFIADVSPESADAYHQPLREIVRRTTFTR